MLSVISGLLASVVALAGCGGDVDLAPPQARTQTTGDRADGAQRVLEDLQRALASGDRTDAVATAAPGADGVLGRVLDNARALRLRDLELRYVDEGAALEESAPAGQDEDAWRGTVQLAYRYAGFDRAPTRVETSVVFLATQDGARIVSFGGEGRTPLWLAAPLSVVRTPRSLAAVAGEGPGRYPGLVRRAVRQVSRVLPDWRGQLVVEVPATREQFDAAVLAAPGEYDNIAAVTTTTDGSLAPDTPVRVFVNPTVFDRLRVRGAQVVMSHEATHVASEATFASMPTWLLEGFADYVALDGAGVPVATAAGQVLARIREEGLPDGLPTSADLDPSAGELGATYEEAWLACRSIGEEYGTRALVRFYRAVDGGSSTQAAFRKILGSSQRAFVERWRADLARLAGVAR